jgi:hypothetical protein
MSRRTYILVVTPARRKLAGGLLSDAILATTSERPKFTGSF